METRFVHLCEDHGQQLKQSLRRAGLGDFMGDGKMHELTPDEITRMCCDKDQFNAMVYAQGLIFGQLSRFTTAIFGGPSALFIPWSDWPDCPICRSLMFRDEHMKTCASDQCGINSWDFPDWLERVAKETVRTLQALMNPRPRKRKPSKGKGEKK